MDLPMPPKSKISTNIENVSAATGLVSHAKLGSLTLSDAQMLAFWSKQKVDGCGCWIWSGQIDSRGYGTYYVRFRGATASFKAHRVAYCLGFGSLIPDGLCVCHACDVRPCVNPAHLFLGTKSDNTLDMIRKDRQPGQMRSWVKHSFDKMSAEDVLALRELFALGTSTPMLAKKFDINQSTAWRIATQKRWKGCGVSLDNMCDASQPTQAAASGFAEDR